jgi:alkyl hydroperoxide reductase subunit AhpF
MKLTNKVAVIPGGNSGIGLAAIDLFEITKSKSGRKESV